MISQGAFDGLGGGGGGSGYSTSGPVGTARFGPDRPISRSSRNAPWATPGGKAKLIARLPAESAAKLSGLISEQDDIGARVQSLAFELSDIAVQKLHAQGYVDRLKATREAPAGRSGTWTSHSTYLTRGAVPNGPIEHHIPAQTATANQLRDAEATVAEIEARRKAVEQRQAEVTAKRSSLPNAILQWLASIPPRITIAEYEPDQIEGFVVDADQERAVSATPTVADIDAIRQQIAELRAAIHTLRSAPLPSSEAKQIARAQVEALAATGEPSCLHLVEHGHKVQFPELHIQGQVLGLNAPALSSHTTPNSLGILAWLFKDQLIAKLEAEIDSLADDEVALSDAAKAEREASIRADILALEREEVAVIEALAASGAQVKYRDDTDCRALLGLASSLPPGPAK